MKQGSVALAGDFTAGKMIFGVEGVDVERRARLVELLDIDVDWSMMTVSDGQRRRVQICMVGAVQAASSAPEA
jgi:CCR4-NOT complex subunit CAF16